MLTRYHHSLTSSKFTADMRPLSISLAASLLAICASACSTESVYYSLRSMQKDACEINPDAYQRDRCLKDQGTSFDNYQRSRMAEPVAASGVSK